MPWLSFLVPFAVELLKLYIKSSDSSKDDCVLDAVQKGCEYLASKDNNTVNYGHVSMIYDQKMKEA
jgi:hypothetical protein